MAKKHSTSETGHVKNVANLNVMIDAIELLDRYDPVNPKITIIDLRKKYTECDDLLKLIDQKETIDDDIINKRQYAFENIGPYSTRLQNSAAVISEDKKLMDDISNVIDKIRGEPAIPLTIEDREGQEVEEARSNSQRSYDNLAAHFNKLVEYIERIPDYVPNEEDLTLDAAKAYLAELIEHNKRASESHEELKKARRDRDHAMYNEDEGLYMRTQTVKLYVKGVYYANSPEFARIRAIKFRNPLKKKKK